MTGWGRGGRCFARAVAPVPQQDIADVAGSVPQQESSDLSARQPGQVAYGSGQGGIPRGCGRGFCGGMRGGRSRPRGDRQSGRF